uniref:Uncharacterized protein n=1 Tax=Mycena chlorophos TaxID=658473 RepID=A0ABQ0LBN3_MYCCL|nr:predicted protein [Mycena chlorophos]
MRKNLRLWAEGNRQKILDPYLPYYAAAMDRGIEAENELLREINCVYNARIDWRTPDHVDPLLRIWDRNALVVPEDLPSDVQATKDSRLRELWHRIRRWFRYRVQRTHSLRRTFGCDPRKDPFACFVLRLSGYTRPKKRRQGYQQYMRESWDILRPIIDYKWEEYKLRNAEAAGKGHKAGFRAAVVRPLFQQLDESVRKALEARAKAECDAENAEYDAALRRAPDKSPEGRLRALKNVPDFAGQVLQEIFNTTGCHATIIYGGPDPEQGGDIIVRHISIGRNLTAERNHWGVWDPSRFKKQVAGFFAEYLQTAYTEADCASSALPGTQSAESGSRRRRRRVRVVGNAQATHMYSAADSDSGSSSDDDQESDDAQEDELDDVDLGLLPASSQASMRVQRGQNLAMPPPTVIPNRRSSGPKTVAASNKTTLRAPTSTGLLAKPTARGPPPAFPRSIPTPPMPSYYTAAPASYRTGASTIGTGRPSSTSNILAPSNGAAPTPWGPSARPTAHGPPPSFPDPIPSPPLPSYMAGAVNDEMTFSGFDPVEFDGPDDDYMAVDTLTDNTASEFSFGSAPLLQDQSLYANGFRSSSLGSGANNMQEELFSALGGALTPARHSQSRSLFHSSNLHQLPAATAPASINSSLAGLARAASTPAPPRSTPASNPSTPAPNPSTPAPNPSTPAPNPSTPAPPPSMPVQPPLTPAPAQSTSVSATPKTRGAGGLATTPIAFKGHLIPGTMRMGFRVAKQKTRGQPPLFLPESSTTPSPSGNRQGTVNNSTPLFSNGSYSFADTAPAASSLPFASRASENSFHGASSSGTPRASPALSDVSTQASWPGAPGEWFPGGGPLRPASSDVFRSTSQPAPLSLFGSLSASASRSSNASQPATVQTSSVLTKSPQNGYLTAGPSSASRSGPCPSPPPLSAPRPTRPILLDSGFLMAYAEPSQTGKAVALESRGNISRAHQAIVPIVSPTQSHIPASIRALYNHRQAYPFGYAAAPETRQPAGATAAPSKHPPAGATAAPVVQSSAGATLRGDANTTGFFALTKPAATTGGRPSQSQTSTNNPSSTNPSSSEASSSDETPDSEQSTTRRRSHRLSASMHPSVRLPCPSDAPEWFTSRYNQFTSVELGLQFDALLSAWTTIESASRFSACMDKFDLNPLPRNVVKAIETSTGCVLTAQQLSKLPGAFAQWWDSLQPDWRCTNTAGQWKNGGSRYGPTRSKNAWGKLFTWGPGGFDVVVGVLFFWGSALLNANAPSKQWEAAVVDATWMLEGLGAFYTNTKWKW